MGCGGCRQKPERVAPERVVGSAGPGPVEDRGSLLAPMVSSLSALGLRGRVKLSAPGARDVIVEVPKVEGF